MTRPGPKPGTVGRDPAEVVAVAAHAIRTGERMAAVVAARYSISEQAARQAISRARQLGHNIPSDLGWSQVGRYDPTYRTELGRHGVGKRARSGCPCEPCTARRAWQATNEQAKAERAQRAANRLQARTDRQAAREAEAQARAAAKVARATRPIPHGTDAGYQRGCRLECCRTAHRDARREYRSAKADRALDSLLREPFVPRLSLVRPSVLLRCACGFTADSAPGMAAHTVAEHRRRPTVAERTPVAA